MSENQTALQNSEPKAVSSYTPNQLALIKRTVANGATNDELAMFLHVAKKSGLDPFMRQIHFVKRKTKDGEVGAIQTGIDGYRTMAARSGEHAGTDDAIFETGEDGMPTLATVVVYRIVKGQRCAFAASARFDEYVQMYYDKKQGKRVPTPMWQKMPFVMLAKCAEALALRKGFPEILSGVYTHEEMMQAGAEPPTTEPTPAPQPEEPKPEPVKAEVVEPTVEPVEDFADKCDAKQIATIYEIGKRIAHTGEDIVKMVKHKFQKDRLSALTVTEATELINELMDMETAKLNEKD